MSSNLGIPASESSSYYMISYSNDDAERITPIVQNLHSLNVELWYDDGIKGGEKWKNKIFNKIKGCNAVIVFVTQALIEKERSFVEVETDYAQECNKVIIPVFLDEFVKNKASPDGFTLLKDLKRMQGVYTSDKTESPTEKAFKIWQRINNITLPPTTPIEQTKKTKFHIPIWVILTAAALIAVITVSVIASRACQIFGGEGGNGLEGCVTTSNSDIPHGSTTKPVPPGPGILHVNDRFTYGVYPQETSEPEAVTWRVLAVKGNRALVISEKILDCQLYNDTYTNVMWTNCTLRKWLNSDFMDMAFTEDEQRRIITVTNSNPDNDRYPDSKGGEDTVDNIFCLSIPEANQYFSGDEDRKAAPTPYAKSRKCAVKDEIMSNGEKSGWWWLRTPGEDNGNASNVYNSGIVYRRGGDVDNFRTGVRPAFWIDFSDDLSESRK